MLRPRLLIPLYLATTLTSIATCDGGDGPRLLEVRRIWEKGAHNAFTDLLCHEDRWYCVFREGSKHVSPNGSLRVITSQDGREWSSLALISHPTDDLRDAKLSITPIGRLMLNGAGMRTSQSAIIRWSGSPMTKVGHGPRVRESAIQASGYGEPTGTKTPLIRWAIGQTVIARNAFFGSTLFRSGGPSNASYPCRTKSTEETHTTRWRSAESAT